MSYADVAHKNTSGPQPRADPALLNTNTASHTTVPDVDSKVNVVPQSFKSNPSTTTSQFVPEHILSSDEDTSSHRKTEKSERRKRKLRKAEDEGVQLWDQAMDRLLRPGVLGGLIGIANVGLIGSFGYQLYYKPHLRTDARTLSTAAVSTLALLTAEGYLAESYRNTQAGQEEERRAREEGALIYRRTKDIVLRPGVLGGLVGVLNLGVLGGIGYVSYNNWDKQYWDRRTVSVVTVGLIGLFTGEGYLAEQYKEKEYPKRK